ncbi:calcium-binding protein [Aliiroseovarius sp. YM-037]|uniref:calcium-binding protein n=1 Tax=Aliiroseovarius sp. YM-037 TaxID=3341728 RepID=UPI003A8102AD
MLGLAGLLGALLAGSFVIANNNDEPDEALDYDDRDDEDAPNTAGNTNILLDDSGAVQGGPGGDLLHGDEEDDQIAGHGGDDWIDGGFGDDHLTGGEGDDELHGGRGDDRLAGDAGNDALYGHNDDDFLSGGMGDDVLVGGDGDDWLNGGDGDDQLQGSAGDDALQGGLGQDSLQGGSGNDALTGVVPDADGIDLDGQDYLNGGAGNDTIALGTGDIASGGTGADTFALGDWIDVESGAQIMDFNPDEDTLVLIYDDSEGDEPEVSVEPDADDPDTANVLVDGQVLASVLNAPGLTAGQISLVAER